MQPVEHDGEFFVVHAVPGERHVGRLGQRVLPQVPFPGLLVHLPHVVRAAEGVRSGQSLQFSMASSGPSSPPQRSTHSSKPRSSKYFAKNSSQAAALARSSSRSSSAQAGGDIGESILTRRSAALEIRIGAPTRESRQLWLGKAISWIRSGWFRIEFSA